MVGDEDVMIVDIAVDQFQMFAVVVASDEFNNFLHCLHVAPLQHAPTLYSTVTNRTDVRAYSGIQVMIIYWCSGIFSSQGRKFL